MNISKDRLTVARQNKGLSQYELADLIAEKTGAFARSNLSLWERGRRNIPMKYLSVLCEILDVSQEYLLGENVDALGTPIDIEEKTSDYEEISYSDLFMYDGLPIYVKFINGERQDAWALYDRLTCLLHFTNQKIKVNANLSKYAKFYLKHDVYVQYSSKFRNSLNMTQFMNAKKMFIRSLSGDDAVRNRIDGWYHHSADKTYLTNDKGNILEYNMLGVTYTAFSVGFDEKG